jgi:hypothetical protein
LFLGEASTPLSRQARTPACTSVPNPDDDLAQLIAAWPALPEHVKLAMLTLIRSAYALRRRPKIPAEDHESSCERTSKLPWG